MRFRGAASGSRMWKFRLKRQIGSRATMGILRFWENFCVFVNLKLFEYHLSTERFGEATAGSGIAADLRVSIFFVILCFSAKNVVTRGSCDFRASQREPKSQTTPVISFFCFFWTFFIVLDRCRKYWIFEEIWWFAKSLHVDPENDAVVSLTKWSCRSGEMEGREAADWSIRREAA